MFSLFLVYEVLGGGIAERPPVLVSFTPLYKSLFVIPDSLFFLHILLSIILAILIEEGWDQLILGGSCMTGGINVIFAPFLTTFLTAAFVTCLGFYQIAQGFQKIKVKQTVPRNAQKNLSFD